MSFKVCIKCGLTKEVQGEFYSHPRMRDGRLNKCKDCCKQDALDHKAANPKKSQYWRRVFEAKNPVFYATKRRKWKEQQVPQWYGELDELAWIEAHDLSERLTLLSGARHSVDHIIPGKGKTVSGLHWYQNWQVIPSLANFRKGVRHAA